MVAGPDQMNESGAGEAGVVDSRVVVGGVVAVADVEVGRRRVAVTSPVSETPSTAV